jgi:hypothetical protein
VLKVSRRFCSNNNVLDLKIKLGKPRFRYDKLVEILNSRWPIALKAKVAPKRLFTFRSDESRDWDSGNRHTANNGLKS